MRLPASTRYSLYGLTALLLGSGIVWLVVHYLEAISDPHTWEATSMRIHGAAAMALLVIVGIAIALHVTRAWQEGKNRTSGLFLGAVLIVLVLTGYLLYYAGGEAARAAASAIHWILGLGLPFLVAVHVSLGRAAD
jgi:succinate dehydrogenase/fumarate reductase cytochrome b subunit